MLNMHQPEQCTIAHAINLYSDTKKFLKRAFSMQILSDSLFVSSFGFL